MRYVKKPLTEKACGLVSCGVRFFGNGRYKYHNRACAKAAQDAQLVALNKRRLAERRKGRTICPTCGQPIKKKGTSDE